MPKISVHSVSKRLLDEKFRYGYFDGSQDPKHVWECSAVSMKYKLTKYRTRYDQMR